MIIEILLIVSVVLAFFCLMFLWRLSEKSAEMRRYWSEQFSHEKIELQSHMAIQLQALREELRQARLDQGMGLTQLTATVQERLEKIQAGGEKRLEEMRQAVDTRLRVTLESRLGESFRVVSESLEQVQRGLGEMRSLAQDVGGLKRVLSHVKLRGVLGEAQLGALLEQFLAPQQYAAQVKVRPRSNEVVEYAVRLPGMEAGQSVWLPIDAKFPLEDYQRLQEALEVGDVELAEKAGKALEYRILTQARDIRDKYIFPPATTDFALLFLPFEGLFGEVLRRPGLVEKIARECKVNVVGPTTLTAFLNSLQVGFRTLAISKQSAEVWKLLAAVKQEFSKFGDSLDLMDRKLDEAKARLGQVTERSRILGQRLSKVEFLHEEEVKLME